MKALLDEGKARRKMTPRTSHEELGTRSHERDIVALIQESNKDRVENLIPIRHTRMMESPFAFFRGSAIVQAADLARTPASGIIVQACGDCHLMNFGGFATPERNLIFDINDFDETFPAPWEWDVKRLAASLVVAARWRGFSTGDCRGVVAAAAERYRERMHELADAPTLDVWYSCMNLEEEARKLPKTAKVASLVKANIVKARQNTSEQVFNKLVGKNGRTRIQDQPPLIFHSKESDDTEVVRKFFDDYAATLREDSRSLFKRFRLVDAAVKVVGVGSVGTRCYIALFLGENDDPLFLQVKEARTSVLERFAGKAGVAHEGERVVTGQRLMQAFSDVFLGWTRGPNGRDFYVRQLRDMKLSAQIEKFDPQSLKLYAEACGGGLARAHAKAGQAGRIAGYLGNSSAFDDALERYALGYGDQVERDFDTFRQAARSGRIRTETSASALETMIS